MTKKSKKNKKKTCILECPSCKRKWAELSYQYNSMVKSTDVRVLDGKSFKDGDDLICSSCQYKYTNWDIVLAIANANKQVQNEKA